MTVNTRILNTVDEKADFIMLKNQSRGLLVTESAATRLTVAISSSA